MDFTEQNAREKMLMQMGIVSWRLRKQPTIEQHRLSVCATDVEKAQKCSVQEIVSQPDPIPVIEQDSFKKITEDIEQCEKCQLCHTRHQVVVGQGNEKSKWLFVGEGPGYYEDKEGLPFVGRSGQLLSNMLNAMSLRREQVYIANIIKCRATDEQQHDRRPSPQEIQACIAFLHRQIALIEPDVIVALGKTAANALLNNDEPVSALRSQTHVFNSGKRKITLVVSFHPSYLLRTPSAKKQAWEDLCRAMDAFDGVQKEHIKEQPEEKND